MILNAKLFWCLPAAPPIVATYDVPTVEALLDGMYPHSRFRKRLRQHVMSC